jgi:uncharacterized membrane protein (DUF2068 family)
MPRLKSPAQATKAAEGGTALLLIAIFKLIKGILLLAVGVGAVKLLHRDLAETVTHWAHVLRVDPENRHIHDLIARVFRVTPKQLRELSVGTFIYASLFLTEGTGLLLRKRWAEYLTIITTGGLIPLEVYEISRHITATNVAVLAINVVIVVYLVIRVRRNRG